MLAKLLAPFKGHEKKEKTEKKPKEKAHKKTVKANGVKTNGAAKKVEADSDSDSDDDSDGDLSSEYSGADPEDRYRISDDEESRPYAVTVSEADSEIAKYFTRTVPIPFSDIPDWELPDTLPLFDPDFPLLGFLRC